MIEPFVHDAGFSGVYGLDLVSAQGSGWQSVVVVLPAIETLEPHFGAAPQQPLCGGSVGTDGFDPFVVHTERRTTPTLKVRQTSMTCEGEGGTQEGTRGLRWENQRKSSTIWLFRRPGWF